MALREILIWPDPRLLEVSSPVETIDDEVKTLVQDMLETMYDADGVGLAAPQVGIQQRVVVIDIFGAAEDRPSGEEPLVLINPEFLLREGELSWEEGCLSVPGETGNVTRAAHVQVRYLDLDYLSRLKRNVIRRKMAKLIAEREADAA
jgi:peptide deformylase